VLVATLVSLASVPIVIRSLAHGDGPEQKGPAPVNGNGATQTVETTPVSEPPA
jgi:hypothetical protein